MKSLRIAGVCLASMFTMSMALATSASAAHWLQCLNNPASTTTRYSSSQCSEASSGGEWSWSRIPTSTSETVELKGTLTLIDTKSPVGETKIRCSGISLGSISSEPTGTITSVTVSSCEGTKTCEKTGAEAKAVDLPWKTELEETESKVLIRLLADGNGEPGWKAKCKVAGVGSEDECKSEAGKPELLLAETTRTGAEQLVLATFEKKRKAECTKGGAESGEVEGSLAILRESGGGLAVSVG